MSWQRMVGKKERKNTSEKRAGIKIISDMLVAQE